MSNIKKRVDIEEEEEEPIRIFPRRKKLPKKKKSVEDFLKTIKEHEETLRKIRDK